MRPRLLILATLGGLLMLVLWSYGQLRASQREVQTARANQKECGLLAAEILEMKGQPVRASMQVVSSSDLFRRVENAAKSASMPIENLVLINPQPVRRIGDTDYKQQQTEMILRHVTLEQMVRFLHALTAFEDSSLSVESIRLLAPRHDAGSDKETWHAEVTLTQLIYFPKS